MGGNGSTRAAHLSQDLLRFQEERAANAKNGVPRLSVENLERNSRRVNRIFQIAPALDREPELRIGRRP